MQIGGRYGGKIVEVTAVVMAAVGAVLIVQAHTPAPQHRSPSHVGGRTVGVAGATTANPSTRLNAFNNKLLVSINAVRRAHGLTPLKPSAALLTAAGDHTTEMGQAGYFTHSSLDHTVFWKRIQRSYASSGHRSWSVGENLLFEAPNVGVSKALGLWMNSPDHRANLLDPAWREIGIAADHFTAAPGIFGNKPVTILTADFGVRQ